MNNSIKLATVVVALAVVLSAVAVLDSTESDAATTDVSTADQLRQAVNGATDADIIRLTGNIELAASEYSNKADMVPFATIDDDVILDLNGHSITWNLEGFIPVNGTDEYTTLLIFSVSGAAVTFNGDGLIDAEAGDCNSYGIEIINNGSLTVNGGTYTGAPTAIQVESGLLTVNDGNFEQAETIADDAPGYANYVVNCIDSSFKDGTAVIELRGGTYCYDFSNKPEGSDTTYVANGYLSKLDETSGKYTVESSTTMQAAIGNTQYATLDEAIAAVPDGVRTTITILNSFLLTSQITIPSGVDITINLDGHDITVEPTTSGTYLYAFSVEGTMTLIDGSTSNVGTISSKGVIVQECGHLILKSGTIDSVSTSGAAVMVNGEFEMNGGTLSVSNEDSENACLNVRENGTAHITGGFFDPSKWTICNLGTLNISGVTLTSDTTNWNSIKIFSGNVTIEDCTFDLSLGGGVEVMSESQYPKPVVTISNSTFTQRELAETNSWNSMCVAVSYGSSVAVNDCTFDTVAYGFYVFSSGGSIEVNGGTYKATGEKPLFQLDADTSSYPGTTAEIIVNGGSFTGTLPTGLSDSEILTIYGGRFVNEDGNSNDTASQYVASGYKLDETTGSVVLDTTEGGEVVATIGDRQFGSLADALTAVKSGQTIVLQNDTKESITIDEGLSITLNLNGHKITNTDGHHTITVKGELTIVDTMETGVVDNVSNSCAAVFCDVRGTVSLAGGSYTRSLETGSSPESGGTNTYYNIVNHGTMYIYEGVTVKQDGHYSSLIENGWYSGSQNDGGFVSIMIIEGGTFTGGLNTIKNDDYGYLTINGGTFTNVEQAAVLNWNVAAINDGMFSVEGAGASAVILNGKADDTMDKGELTITGGEFNGPVAVQMMTNSSSLGIGKVRISGGDFNVTEKVIDPLNGNSTDVEVSGGTYNMLVDDEFLANGFVMTGTDGNYGVGQGYLVIFEVTPSDLAATITITDSNGRAYQYEDGRIYLPNGHFTYTYSAEGYISGQGSFDVSGAKVSVSITLIQEGTTVTVTLEYEIGWPSKTVEVPYGGTLTSEQIPVEGGFVVDTSKTQIPGNVTNDVKVKVHVAPVDPVITDVSVIYDGGTAFIIVTAQHPLEGVVLWYFIDPSDMSTENVLTVSESGTYEVQVGAEYNNLFSLGTDVQEISVEIPKEPEDPDNPPFIPGGDDNDYVPIPPVIVDDGSSDDDTVKIVACAACAVVAAVMGALLVFHRRD